MQSSSIMETNVRPAVAPLELQHEIEQFLYREAALLDNRQYEEWYDLLAADLRYFMPLRTNRYRREAKLEFSSDSESAYFDDDKHMMKVRIRKMRAPNGWAEDPPSRTRHLVTNVIVEPDNGLGYEVSVAFLLYRNRGERQVDVFAGERKDVLRRADNALGFEIVSRTILLDQATFLANNISFFF